MTQQPSPKEQFQYQTFQLLPEESLGVGSYGKVCKAIIDQLPCAAKLLHPVLFQFNDPGSETVVRRFEQECKFLSEIRHPHVVQYLGIARDPDTGLPILLMELMDDSLTRFLEKSKEPLPYHLQVNLCYDVALAVAYLHLNGIIHRDLSSNNVLLIAGSRAKVTDFGMSKLSEMHPHMTNLTMVPGTLVYMPPEASMNPPVYTWKLDVFSIGVLAVQIITCKFPAPGPACTVWEDARSPTGNVLVPVPEVDRRKNHIDLIDLTHPLLPISLDCLRNREEERPSAKEFCQRMAELKVELQYKKSVAREMERKKGDSGLLEALAAKDRDVLEKNKYLREKDVLIHDRDNRIQSLEQEVCILNRKIKELKEDKKHCQEHHNVQEMQHNQHQLHVGQVQPSSLVCKVSGTGLKTATSTMSSHFSIEITDFLGRPCSSSQHVTTELKSIAAAGSVTMATVEQKSPTTYEVTYTPNTRGRYELCVRLNGAEIKGSPFRVVVFPHPTQLSQQVGIIAGVQHPYGVAVNSHGEMYATEWNDHHIAMLDRSGRRIRTIGSKGNRPGHFEQPCFIAIDSNDNVYVTSFHKLQKFNRNGEFVKSVGGASKGRKPGEFSRPAGIRVHQNQVYVCDGDNDRIQVFDLRLTFITSFGSKGSGQGQFSGPADLSFDSQGNIYVSEIHNNRIQVLDTNGRYLHQFGHASGPGELNEPRGLEIALNFVYVSDTINNRIAVFHLSGSFLTSFGKYGTGRGKFWGPLGIFWDHDGHLYVCDMFNHRIQVF